MVVQCPGCETKYNVPVDKVNLGQKQLRCSRCGKTFELGGESAQDPVEPTDSEEQKDIEELSAEHVHLDPSEKGEVWKPPPPKPSQPPPPDTGQKAEKKEKRASKPPQKKTPKPVAKEKSADKESKPAPKKPKPQKKSDPPPEDQKKPAQSTDTEEKDRPSAQNLAAQAKNAAKAASEAAEAASIAADISEARRLAEEAAKAAAKAQEAARLVAEVQRAETPPPAPIPKDDDKKTVKIVRPTPFPADSESTVEMLDTSDVEFEDDRPSVQSDPFASKRSTPKPTPAPKPTPKPSPAESGDFDPQSWPDDDEFSPRGNQGKKVGIAFAVVFVVIAFLALFVLARNDWQFTDPPSMISIAFSGGSVRSVDEMETQNVEAVMATRENGQKALMVRGLVFNASSFAAKQNVIVTAQIVGSTGNVVAEKNAPCGRTWTQNDLAKLSPREVNAEYDRIKQTEQLVSPQKTIGCSVVFDEVPAGYSIASYQAKLIVIQADPVISKRP